MNCKRQQDARCGTGGAARSAGGTEGGRHGGVLQQWLTTGGRQRVAAWGAVAGAGWAFFGMTFQLSSDFT